MPRHVGEQPAGPRDDATDEHEREVEADILLGKLRERYGEVKDKVEQQVDDFIESL